MLLYHTFSEFFSLTIKIAQQRQHTIMYISMIVYKEGFHDESNNVFVSFWFDFFVVS
jgi:hypothetical protein